MWEDVDIQGEEEDDDAGDEGVDDDDTEEIVVHDAAIATIRQRGKILRYELKYEKCLPDSDRHCKRKVYNSPTA